MSQARAARDENEEPHREPNDLLRDTTSDTDASSYSMLDHLLDKAMKEKVSRESDPGNPEPSDYLQNSEISFVESMSQDQDDSKQQSRFKYLFFEILTPDEYNDIIYLGEDLLNPLQEKLKGDEGSPAESSEEKTTETKFTPDMAGSEILGNTKNDYQSKLTASQDNARVDERKNKMENLLRKMTDRYNTRTESNFHDTIEEGKTKKLKNMIDILQDKLEKYQPQDNSLKKISGRRIEHEPSYLQQMAERGIQKSRTTPSSYQSSYKYTSTSSPKRKEEVKEKWNDAMETLSDKISRMGSGIHRLNLDEMLDLDMLEVPSDDQKSSDSYPGTTAVPPSHHYDSQLGEKKVPKRQVTIHPKLTYQRQDFGEVHRPSSKLKDLIREKEEGVYVSPGSPVRTLPPISRYHDPEPAYKPTSAFLRPDECPYIPARPYSECYNAPASECSNIGYPDPACAPGSVCCYDGCINLCWSNPNLPPRLPPLAPPPAQYSTTTTTTRPKVYGYTLEPVVHTTTTTAAPVVTTTEGLFYPPVPPPGPGYLPPLENSDAVHHHVHHVHHGKDGKALQAVPHILYPPPSPSYKQPSISFIAKGETGHPHLPSHSTLSPAPHYKDGKSLDYKSKMQHYQVPSKSYLGKRSI